MRLLELPRIPEPEIMAGEDEAESYASAAALRHLDALDDAFVERALGLGIDSGMVLDVGTGPGQVPIKLAVRNPDLLVHAIDLSDAMLRRAAMDAGRWGVDLRVLFNRGDATEIPYDAELFDMVVCNSVLHHVSDPVRLVREMDRVCKPRGALLLRDLRRPNRLAFRWHVRRHGRNYDGKMRDLFEASVCASYTVPELQRILERSEVQGLQVFRMGGAHLGFERRKEPGARSQ